MNRSPQHVNRDTDASWLATQRWQQLDGEQRANALRVLALATLIAIHLGNYYRPLPLFELETRPELWFHQAVTTLVAAWIVVALAVFQLLRQRVFPKLFSYVTTGVDIALLTALLCLGGGQTSPLVHAYALILILAALRFNLLLIRFATLACTASYLFVMAAAKWPHLLNGRQIGRVPRYNQLMTIAAKGIAGIMLGQLIRRIRTMAQWYALRTGHGESVFPEDPGEGNLAPKEPDDEQ